ncbi:ATP-dependent Clp protease ATP-binding subunit [Ructibacterium gallinarum]|uniref:ATP-dependent Clp protease ATP-binding subunit n=1 Tax=Ructibacterium gallinarum TaxID=2779355 RepID=A0A9D5M0Z7_9FIRM|nr:ATP-dependent Clp protease ATP-binding subunit [Ructibacterium gallinarum]MBE5039443.1 ATP-dependent Clp protease ATP-binding subunit [Ructibacterium gallinarum]
MLCCKCHKNLAVVYISKLDINGKTVNEGYCLTCAKELNLGPVNEIMQNMGINPEEMDGLNREMSAMLEEMGDDFDMAEGMKMMRQELSDGTEEDNDEDDEDENKNNEENMSRSMQKNPFELMNRLFSSQDGEKREGQAETAPKNKEKKNKKKRNLDTYAINLTAKAQNGQIDRVIGRDKEMERTAQILNRRTKNNPCLIGEPGVGKTAIAEGLALKIVQGDVPAKLLNYEIYLLDMTAVVAGTQFRGQFESRLRNIIEEVKKLGNIILVIDEIHTIASAGDAEGGMNAGNILKPALSRGEIQVIGATTIEEYRKHIEKDAALERRFQTVLVEEPTIEETIEILKGIKDYYEEYHKVLISDDLIRTATVLAERYISDRFLPDKAIDVIDEAASRVNLENNSLVEEEKLKMELKQLRKEEEDASGADSIEDYEKAADRKSRECQIEARLSELAKEEIRDLTADDIAAVIELWTKIPVKHISEFETSRLINLEERLHQRLIGQDDAVHAVACAIRRKRAGISLKRRPVSFIFVGPTGVGKTELVKRIAQEVFDGEDSLIRLDMSEYMEKHSVAKLIGSPPGYVGYDDAGQLTEKIRRHPYSVILLDEIEKAHEDVFNILLQILDDGRITDSHGKTVSFENTIIIMTSNAGSDQKSNIVGFNEDEEAGQMKVERALKALFRPEFLNRVDETVIFKELKKEELLQIIDLMLDDLREGLKEKEIELSVSEAAKHYVLEHGYQKIYGARPMRRFIEKHIEDILAQKLIEGELHAGTKACVDVQNDQLTVMVN